jgi:hypothetical protein
MGCPTAIKANAQTTMHYKVKEQIVESKEIAENKN